jgi:hypothetical protein
MWGRHAFVRRKALDVGDEPVGSARRSCDVGHHPMHVGLGSGVHADECPFGRKQLGDSLADSPSRAGDDDHLARKSR